MLRKDFSNQETFVVSRWLVNSDELYQKICKNIDLTNSHTQVANTIQEIINSIVCAAETGVGSKEIHYMLEDVGDLSQINYDELATSFLEE